MSIACSLSVPVRTMRNPTGAASDCPAAVDAMGRKSLGTDERAEVQTQCRAFGRQGEGRLVPASPCLLVFLPPHQTDPTRYGWVASLPRAPLLSSPPGASGGRGRSGR